MGGRYTGLAVDMCDARAERHGGALRGPTVTVIAIDLISKTRSDSILTDTDIFEGLH